MVSFANTLPNSFPNTLGSQPNDDETAPTVSGAYATASTLYVPWSEAVNNTGTGITVVTDGDTLTLGSVSGDDGTSLRQFPFSRPLEYGETITITISSSNIEDLAGNGVEDATDIPVTNLVPNPDGGGFGGSMPVAIARRLVGRSIGRFGR